LVAKVCICLGRLVSAEEIEPLVSWGAGCRDPARAEFVWYVRLLQYSGARRNEPLTAELELVAPLMFVPPLRH
jgi:hypothetical protein